MVTTGPRLEDGLVGVLSGLADGERVLVPDLSGVTPTLEGSSGPKPKATSAWFGDLVDINTASRADLESLPGIGLERALRIIAHRQAHGAFETIEDIQDVLGIDEEVFEMIEEMISVGDSQ